VLDLSHTMGDWKPFATWPTREERRCLTCGAQEEREPNLKGYHGAETRLAEPCGQALQRQGMLMPVGAALVDHSKHDRTKRYPYFEMRYPLAQDDGSVAVETMRFPVAEGWGQPMKEASDEYGSGARSQPKRGVGGQVFE